MPGEVFTPHLDEKGLQNCAQALAKKLKINRGKLCSFFNSPKSYDLAIECYEKIEIEGKPPFEDVLEYILGYEKDPEIIVGEDAVKIFDKYAKDLAEICMDRLPEETIVPKQPMVAHEVLKSVAEYCGLTKKSSITTLSSSSVSVKSLTEVLSEEVIGMIQRRENLDFRTDTKQYLETAMMNPRMPRQALVKAIQVLMAKEWQLKMLKKFGELFRGGMVASEDVEKIVNALSEKPNQKESLPQRPPVEKTGLKVSPIKRMKDQMSK
jgi:hypothetical protein